MKTRLLPLQLGISQSDLLLDNVCTLTGNVVTLENAPASPVAREVSYRLPFAQ